MNAGVSDEKMGRGLSALNAGVSESRGIAGCWLMELKSSLPVATVQSAFY